MYTLLTIIPIIQGIILDTSGTWLYWIWNIMACIGIYETVIKGQVVEIVIKTWGDWELGCIYNGTSMTMVWIVYLIGHRILIYSSKYMVQDLMFYKAIAIFMSIMVIVVIMYRGLQITIGWEWIGYISYILISYWWAWIFNRKAGLQAIMYNKIGDILLLILISYYYNHDEILLIAFIITSMAKSAQLILKDWLNQAMAGPTPVSSLLHSSTMVILGVYLLVSHHVIDLNLSYVGSFTTILAGIWGVFTYDLKSIIAYSTCSQVGYMYGYQLIGISPLFHIIIHALFKSLLFIIAGIIIVNINSQDIRKVSSYGQILLLDSLIINLGVVSLNAMPYTSGYYSKESLLINALHHNYIIEILSYIGAYMTYQYSIKLTKVQGLQRIVLPSTSLNIYLLVVPVALSIILTGSLITVQIEEAYINTYLLNILILIIIWRPINLIIPNEHYLWSNLLASIQLFSNLTHKWLELVFL